MPHSKGKTGRHLPVSDSKPRMFPLATALRATLREGYSLARLRADAMAGLVVGIVALPLSMALAIASGVPPQHGLYTAIVAGGLIAVTGGSRTNVSGPTAAFVVLLAPISAKYGVAGLALASAMAGVILLGMGLARLGRLIQFVPHPVTTGFTAGIAVVIATLQLKDFFGLSFTFSGEHYWDRVAAIAGALPTINWADLVVGAASLVVLILWPRVTRRVPGPLVAVVFGAALAWALMRFVDGATVATIGSRFSYLRDGVSVAGIPQLPPLPVLPWQQPGLGDMPLLTVMRELIGPAFAIAALGAIESLLSAVVADGMAGTKHDPDAELVGQGIGNIIGPFFGGIAATGAIARTATNIRSGGRSPVASIVHALFVLVAVLALAPVLAYLPMASMAALLLIVAWNMSDIRHFGHMLRVAPRSDLTVLLICFGLTVLFDMVIAVTVGIVLAALLFMRRMAEISGARLVSNGAEKLRAPLPPGVLLYEIAGPLFFGAADKAMSAIATAGAAKVLILDLSAVPAMDVTGLVALESTLGKLRAGGVRVYLCGVQTQPRRVMHKAGITENPGVLHFRPGIEQAVQELSV